VGGLIGGCNGIGAVRRDDRKSVGDAGVRDRGDRVIDGGGEKGVAPGRVNGRRLDSRRSYNRYKLAVPVDDQSTTIWPVPGWKAELKPWPASPSFVNTAATAAGRLWSAWASAGPERIPTPTREAARAVPIIFVVCLTGY
jgi:hypothetical protein